MTVECDRAFMVDKFRQILTGWRRNLVATSPSCAVWETPSGIRTENFLSRSGKQCDGVTRMLPAFAAWVSQPENPPTITMEYGAEIRPLQLLRDGLVNGTDPQHPDFWEYAPTDRNQQRQVESSVVAWSLWLSREQLLPTLSKREIGNIQKWLESCTVCMDLWNNWSLFFATNHAARIALEKWGFRGDINVVRKNLIPGDETDAGDGWMYDVRWSGLDYYNFWVNGSHHLYIRTMLPEYHDPLLQRAVERAKRRLGDLPYLIDADGRQVLFGRSLAYRFGWLNGLMAAEFSGNSPVTPGLARVMLAKNLASWSAIGMFNDDGGLRERLGPKGSDGGRDRYINCGHPYWCMQSFLCLALPSSHPFWSAPAAPLPNETDDFLIARQGPGFVFHGRRAGREVRLYNFRNLNHHGHALYEKFVYSSAHPCNAALAATASGDVEKERRTCWDNQFAMRLADGTHVGPAEVPFVDVGNGRQVQVVLRYKPTSDCTALVRTLLEIEADGYRTSHAIKVTGAIPGGALWIEGGFPVAPGSTHAQALTKNLAGWEKLHRLNEWRELCSQVDFSQPFNIVRGAATHFLLTAPVRMGETVLEARHRAPQ